MMKRPRQAVRSAALGVAVLLAAAGAAAQTVQPENPSGGTVGVEPYPLDIMAGKLLGTPITGVFPGNVPIQPQIGSPVDDDPQAIQRGMRYFTMFNCVGCHAPNGAGGMGPSLSGRPLIYGAEPAQIYLTIYQGRPRGMPAWGAMLSNGIIWDLVAYVRNLGRQPSGQWGVTVSPQQPRVEQVPAEYSAAPDPWSRTESFSRGRKPNTSR